MHTRKIDKNSVLDNMTFLGEQIEEMNLTPKEKESLFKKRVIEQLMAAAMMAEIDILAVDQLAESFRMKNEMLAIIRKDKYVTERRGYKYAHYLLTEFGIQQGKYHKFLSAVGGTPMSRHSKSLSTYKLIGGAAGVPHGNSKAANILDILNDEYDE